MRDELTSLRALVDRYDQRLKGAARINSRTQRDVAILRARAGAAGGWVHNAVCVMSELAELADCGVIELPEETRYRLNATLDMWHCDAALPLRQYFGRARSEWKMRHKVFARTLRQHLSDETCLPSGASEYSGSARGARAAGNQDRFAGPAPSGEVSGLHASTREVE